MQLFLLSKYQLLMKIVTFLFITMLYQYFETLIKIYCVFMFLFIHNNNNINNNTKIIKVELL